MSSDRKREANQRNAEESTGPKTSAGKARASLNALKDGLFTPRLLPGEEDVYQVLLIGLADCLRSVGLLEWFFVRLIAIDMLRLMRFEAAEYASLQGAPDDGRGGGPLSSPRPSDQDLRKVKAYIEKKLAGANSAELPTTEERLASGAEDTAEKPPTCDWHASVLEGVAPAGQGGSLTHLYQSKRTIEGDLQRKIKLLVALQERRTTINSVPWDHDVPKARKPRRKRSDNGSLNHE